MHGQNKSRLTSCIRSPRETPPESLRSMSYIGLVLRLGQCPISVAMYGDVQPFRSFLTDTFRQRARTLDTIVISPGLHLQTARCKGFAAFLSECVLQYSGLTSPNSITDPDLPSPPRHLDRKSLLRMRGLMSERGLGVVIGTVSRLGAFLWNLRRSVAPNIRKSQTRLYALEFVGVRNSPQGRRSFPSIASSSTFRIRRGKGFDDGGSVSHAPLYCEVSLAFSDCLHDPIESQGEVFSILTTNYSSAC